MIKNIKIISLVNMISTIFVGFSLLGMDEDVGKSITLNNPNSLVVLSQKAMVKNLLRMEPHTIKTELSRLPEELRETTVKYINKEVDLLGSTILHKSSFKKYIENLLVMGANPDCCNVFGDNVLLWYLKKDRLNDARFLLQNAQKIDVNRRNRYGVCALDSVDVIKDEKSKNELESLLFKHGARRTFINTAALRMMKYSNSFLKWAYPHSISDEIGEKTFRTYMGFSKVYGSLKYLRSLDERTKKALIAYAKQPIDRQGLTHLHTARSQSEVQKLLGLSVDSAAETVAQERPLHSQIQRGYVRSACELIRNVTPEYCNQPDAYHMTPLCYAVLSGDEYLVRLLLNKGDHLAQVCYFHEDNGTIRSPVHLLALTRNEKLVPLLLTKKVTQRLNVGVRLDGLSYALEHDKSRLFKSLITDGRTVNSVYGSMEESFTMLMYLLKQKKRGSLEKIFSNSRFGDDGEFALDFNAKNNRGVTALMSALENEPDIVRLLIERGALVNDVDNYGNRVLHCAVHNKAPSEIIKILLDNGADINAQNSEGETALHRAVEKNYLEAVKLLVKRGADVRVQNNRGEIPWESALRLGSEDCGPYIRSQWDVALCIV